MCKKTDGTSSRQKEYTWSVILNEFKSQGETHRTIKQLKYKFENMKKNAKKEASKERQEMRRTGGGPPHLPPTSEDPVDWIRSIMSSSIDGNEAVYDDDVLTSQTQIIPSSLDTVIAIEILDEGAEIQEQKNTKIESTKSSIDENSATEDTNMQKKWAFDASTPHSSLKRPVSSPLKRLTKKRDDTSARRLLHEKKVSVLDELNVVEVQKLQESIKQQRAEHEQRIEQNNEKHELEMKKLRLEIEILESKKLYINMNDSVCKK